MVGATLNPMAPPRTAPAVGRPPFSLGRAAGLGYIQQREGQAQDDCFAHRGVVGLTIDSATEQPRHTGITA